MNEILWTVLRTVAVGIGAYAALVLVLRVSGKRSLSKWNGFDYVVTIAIGSSLATAMLSRTTSLVQGITAFVVLAGLQFAVTWMLVRRPSLSRFVTTSPRILLWNGEFCRDAMRRERVPESEIRTAIRARGISDITKVVAVVLETDGNFSVLQQPLPEVEADSSLSGIDR